MKYSVNDPSGKKIPIRNIYCVGRNYVDHIQELKNAVPRDPVFFQKSISSLNTSRNIVLPKDRDIHYELEIVALIAQAGIEIVTENVWQHISGLGLGLDLTDRALQTSLKRDRLPWFSSKSFSGSAVVSDFHEPDFDKWSQEFWFKINGRQVQNSSLDKMIFSIPELICKLSQSITLLPGDLLFTGTPKGVGALHPGDNCELGLGRNILGKYDISRKV